MARLMNYQDQESSFISQIVVCTDTDSGPGTNS
jgi:hypothetical protein